MLYEGIELLDERVAQVDPQMIRNVIHALRASPKTQEKLRSGKSAGNNLISWLAGFNKKRPESDTAGMWLDDSLPDIDIDFDDTKRHLVFEYMERKYGKDRVARLGTVAMYQPRSALAESGAALNIPKWLTDNVSDTLIERSSADSRALDTLEDTLKTTPSGQELLKRHPEIIIATKMQGHPRHSSQHASGVVVTAEPVRKYVAIDSRTGATQCDKYDAEPLSLVKIDALGLKQLSIVGDALRMLGKPHDFMDSVPLDDPAAFDVINKKQFSGIFQFNGLAMQSLSQQTIMNHFDDIVAITALARPGPMTSGGASDWVYRKNGYDPRIKQKIGVTYPHPLFEPYLKDTKGVVAFQEQIMSIGREIGDLTWADVTALRKAMSKSLGEEYFNQFGDRWKAGALKKGIPIEVLNPLWNDLCAFGAWGMNKSHCVAYGIISYWCCWLKAHHPMEFAAATLSHEKDISRQILTLREMHEEGIGYIPVDAEISTDKWEVGTSDGGNGQRMLVGPVQNVKGIGPKLMSQIMSARARNEPLPARALKLLANPVTPIDTLWPVQARIKEICPNLRDRNILTEPTPIGSVSQEHTEELTLLFLGVAKTINIRDENEPIMVARRGYRINRGPVTSLNLQLEDDSGIIYCKINRYKFADYGKSIVDRGRPEKSIYAVKGTAMAGRRFLMVDSVRYMGDMDPKYTGRQDEVKPEEEKAPTDE